VASDRTSAPAANLRFILLLGGAAAGLLVNAATGTMAQDRPTARSFVENFDELDTARWYVSDGWANGEHQNCTWSKAQVSIADGILRLGFEKQHTQKRSYACGEIQTNRRFGHGTYEARIKAAAGSGLNTGFFSFIGPAHKQPHDEIDFEFLGKDTSQVQLNQYVAGKGGNEKLVAVAGGADQGFNDYAFVWEEDRIRWYINGQLVHTADDPAKLPSHASKIYLSLWGSDTMKSWMGRFSEPDGQVSAEVDWVAFTAAGDACQFPESVACSLE
jgi:endo-1,3-1,4-beta-glycanase ExoK